MGLVGIDELYRTKVIQSIKPAVGARALINSTYGNIYMGSGNTNAILYYISFYEMFASEI